MKIFGNEDGPFKIHVKEPGFLFGENDVLKGDKKATSGRTITIAKVISYSSTGTIEQKLYLHIARGLWSAFTGKIRECLLSWRWKSVYLDHGDGQRLSRALACTSVYQGDMPEGLQKILGKTLFEVNLIKKNCYSQIFRNEYIRARDETVAPRTLKIRDPLSFGMGVHYEYRTKDLLCPIYRKRSLFSTIGYYVRKYLSSRWQELSIQVGDISEKILIHKNDRDAVLKATNGQDKESVISRWTGWSG